MSQIVLSHVEYIADYGAARYSRYGEVYLERHYTVMALLGGGPRQTEIEPCFALRGMPDDANPLTRRDFYLLVEDRETDRDRYISRHSAEEWVERGDAEWVGAGLITDPDYFGPSWLYAEELDTVYHEYLRREASPLPCVEATLAAMHPLPEARLVYWFGN